eukprot:COSAG04_NODE_12940_length_627_cov_1.147727_1_plen_107_part_10
MLCHRMEWKLIWRAMPGQDGPLANREDALLAGLRAVGKARVPPGTVVRLTRTLYIGEKPSDNERRNCLCECRGPPPPRREGTSAGGACAAGCGGRAEGRRRCAQAWS